MPRGQVVGGRMIYVAERVDSNVQHARGITSKIAYCEAWELRWIHPKG